MVVAAAAESSRISAERPDVSDTPTKRYSVEPLGAHACMAWIPPELPIVAQVSVQVVPSFSAIVPSAPDPMTSQPLNSAMPRSELLPVSCAADHVVPSLEE